MPAEASTTTTTSAGRRPPRRAHRGAFLLEATIAGAVLAFGLLGLARWQARLGGEAELAAQRSAAVRIAADELDLLRAGGAPSSSPVPPPGVVANDLPTPPGTGRSSSWQVERRIDTTPVAGAVDVSIDVAWTPLDGRRSHVRLRTIVARSDPEWAGALWWRGATPEPTGTLVDLRPRPVPGRRSTVPSLRHHAACEPRRP